VVYVWLVVTVPSVLPEIRPVAASRPRVSDPAVVKSPSASYPKLTGAPFTVCELTRFVSLRLCSSETRGG
jgi:hypothetical protein